MPERSIFLAALGGEVERLRPEVRRYAEGPGDGIGILDGVFDVAGSRFRWLGLAARPFVGAELLVTRYEREVPFRVCTRLVELADGRVELQTERSFSFRKGVQRFVDALLAGPTPGTLSNPLGRDRRLEVLLRCDATAEGHLRLRSETTWIRLGRRRVRLPKFLGMQVEGEDGYDEATGRQTIRTTARNLLLGTVLEYRGSFVYRIEARSTEEPPT
jgi:hypothetical protein